MAISLIGLDADDTLWHNETIFRAAQGRFVRLLADYAGAARIEAELEAVERRNLHIYGYGAKGFTLSMLETALGLSDHQLGGQAVAEILAMGRGMMRHPVEPLPGVGGAIEALSRLGRLVLITKGDLFHQEAKLAASGLGAFFTGVEIVSEKSPETYRRIFRRYDVAENEALMAGNSVRSDILPPLEIGGHAALVPYPLVWAHESGDAPHGHPRFKQLASLADLPAWIETLNSAGV